jgi:hypothetical protein
MGAGRRSFDPVDTQALHCLVPDADRRRDSIMPEFRKKPVVIAAHQWGVQNDASMPGWLRDAVVLQWPILGRNSAGLVIRMGEQLHIGTLEGTMIADPGDWIIRGVKGELYPCKPDIFAATYEPA